MKLKDAEIKALCELVEDKREQIRLLESLLTTPKCNDYTKEAPKKAPEAKFVPSSRSGWRSMVQVASDETIPAPSDSHQALEQRVREQGGST
ncbi:hypothetical protein KGP36_03270 [Patescibacteria group bacterium]|nr:hypothetical protein [Patescibacteria group bacterium]